MVPAKVAAQKAAQFARTVFEGSAHSEVWGSDVLLEEVDRGKVDGADVWLITLSAPGWSEVPFPVEPPRRQYKVFTVDGETGEVLAMRIRELAAIHE
jgi:hypothetical protein